MITEIQLRLDPAIAYNEMHLKATVSTKLEIDANRIFDIIITRRAIDARQKKVIVNISANIYIDEHAPEHPLFNPIDYRTLSNNAPKAIIVGAGPAGLFAALRLIELNICPIVLERGKDVDSRRVDMAKIAREGIVNPNSNYCFGEGGAGAFSDGKLYTRSKKRGQVDKILRVFYQHGAQESILIDSHPHIGTDRLPVVIKAMRKTIERCGGSVLFESQVTNIILNSGNTAIGVRTADDREYFGPVILATGHSARDVYSMLLNQGVNLQPKGIAVGVRLEHQQHLIDCIQYHSKNGRGKYLPAAEYSMLTRVDNRAVYSFCMCPGGVIIPAASAPGEMVVNGMSSSSRGSRWSNSGMVVEVLPEDIEGDNPLKMMHFQQQIEKCFFEEAGNTQNAPAQRMTDFVNSRLSKSLPSTSYAPGIHPARIDKLLPKFIAYRLQKGFIEFGRKQKGFLSDEATLIGDETRTSSPVRIPRDSATLTSQNVKALFPCGEGAGYAGGITSAAIDGERCAEALAEYLKDKSC